MLKLNLSRQTEKLLKEVPIKHSKQIANKIMELRNDPAPIDSIQLKGKRSDLRRATSGEYRIIYKVDGDVLMVILVGKRNDAEVYKLLQRVKKTVH